MTSILQSLRICLLFLGYGEGGLEKHVIELANGLFDHGHEVLLICDPRMSGKVAPGVRVFELNADRSRSNPFLLYGVFKSVAGFSPDVLHAHGRKAMQVAMRLKSFLHCSVIGSVHNNRPRRNERLDRLDRVVCVSKGVASGIGIANARIIYNGIHKPPSAGSRSRGDFVHDATEPWHLLAVGRLKEDKGFDVLLQAMAVLENSDLQIAGEGPERERLERQVRQLGLRDRVSLLGYRNDVPHLMASADLLVISSRNEGFSYVFAEALMNRLPVVSTDVPIANELLPRELLCPAGASMALAARIHLALTASPDQLARWFEPLFEFADTRLTLGSMISEFETLYAEVSRTS